ncbi:ACS family hexuronate transporter-like MFS transporter [Breznakibacter xylanolyticus]|uniref:ACS family hexuronate transporter-like MFS transporter n=1 Tax=Breznakibacter xylanolyticus TaxID=990 RepID=A0A2W7NJW3_9BACT|nr:MFS transporter [Breznakibacter xylanolyticus]MBN2744314.1 MFS transporter [Marinilabiliaceae bacterium]PZX20150.1 ACS family hexuronate transporter-like MFS transporter [Breznakibacter xylanolyticus]
MSSNTTNGKMTNYRWAIVSLLFFATTVNYLDRQVLSLTWKDFIAPEFHWTNNDYGNITALFSIFYAASMLFAGRFVDWMDTKKGFLWAIGVWSIGAILHAYCGIATSGIVAGEWFVGFEGALHAIEKVNDFAFVATVSVSLFIFARLVLAVGEAGNFPAAIKATAEFFPKKDRALATSIFNAGATVGALAAPVTIPVIAAHWGWEMSFVVIGALGFIWMGFWQFMYKKPEVHPRINKAELEYIHQDTEADKANNGSGRKMSFGESFKYKQTWAFAFGKFMTDGVWWFFLFWTPAYLSDVYGLTSDKPMAQILLFVLYAITLLSIIGGWLPSYFVDKKGMNPYAGRMRSMLIFAFFPLLALLAQPLGHFSYWFPVLIIGIAGAAHQAWSANIFSTVGDMFPKSAIATITGIGGMAGGIGSFLINKGSGLLFDFASGTTLLDGKEVVMTKDLIKTGAEYVQGPMKFMGFTGIEAGYFIIFAICAVAYLIGWMVMKSLVPKYSPIKL